MRRAIAIVLMLSVVGCSNHPIVDDVTPYTTYDVVHKVRCEAWEALDAYAKEQRFDVNEILRVQKAIKGMQDALNNNPERAKLHAEISIINAEIDETTTKLLTVKLHILGLKRRLEGRPDTEAMLSKVKALQNRLRATNNPHIIKKIEEDTSDLEALLAEEDTWPGEQQQIADRLKKLESEVRTRVALNEALEIRKEKSKEELKEKFKEAEDALQAQANRFVDKGDGKPGDLALALTFFKSTIAMQFRFDITENNVAKLDGAYAMPVHLGSLILGYSAGSDRTRRGDRAVGIASTFEYLLDEKKVRCDRSHPASERATLYPITGNVGIRELVRQYLKITENAILGPSAIATKQFTDKVVFTTKINAGVAPKLELRPTPLHKLTINGDLSARREDAHEVIVDIAPPPKKDGSTVGPAKISIESVPELGIRITRDRDVAVP